MDCEHWLRDAQTRSADMPRTVVVRTPRLAVTSPDLGHMSGFPSGRIALTCGDAIPWCVGKALIGWVGSGGGVGSAGADCLGCHGCADR